MTLSNIFILASVAIYLLGVIPYFYHIFHGRVVPHAFSWTVWTILATINTIGLITHIGLGFSIIMPIVGTLTVTFWAIIGWFLIKKIQIAIFDYICLFLAFVVVWIVYFRWFWQAVIPSIFVDLLILAPTIRKLWHDPRTEDLSAWLGAAISRLCFVLSLGTYAFHMDNIWWWYTVVINLIVALVIFYRTRYMERWINRIKSIFSLFALKKKLW